VHRCEAPLMRHCFPYIGADLRKLVVQPDTSEHCKTADAGYCIMRCACLLPQLLLGTHSSLPTEDGIRLNRRGCLVLRRGGLPVQRLSPT